MGVVGDDSGTHVAGRSAKARQLPILAVTGLAREARLIAGSGFATIGAGGNSVRLKDMLDARVSPGCSAVVSIGKGNCLYHRVEPKIFKRSGSARRRDQGSA
jgi:hypothetical protein